MDKPELPATIERVLTQQPEDAMLLIQLAAVMLDRQLLKQERANQLGSGAEIRKMLVISTAHLPQELMDELAEASSDHGGPTMAGHAFVYHPMYYGGFLWVPDAPQESWDVLPDEERPEKEILAIQLYARKLGCDYVLLDCDGPRVDDLTWFGEGCDATCAEHAKDCDGYCDHDDEHQNACLKPREGGPPYDAATATGMYDHDDSN